MSHIWVLNVAICSLAPGKLDPSVVMYLAYLKYLMNHWNPKAWVVCQCAKFCVGGYTQDSYRAIRNWDLGQLVEILQRQNFHRTHCWTNYQKLKIKCHWKHSLARSRARKNTKNGCCEMQIIASASTTEHCLLVNALCCILNALWFYRWYNSSPGEQRIFGRWYTCWHSRDSRNSWHEATMNFCECLRIRIHLSHFWWTAWTRPYSYCLGKRCSRTKFRETFLVTFLVKFMVSQ